MKDMLLIITLVLTLAASSAFADNADRKTGDVAYNGITYFDSVPGYTMPETAVVMAKSGETPFNGITYFDLGQPGTAKRNYSASASAAKKQVPEQKPYNGITLFE